MDISLALGGGGVKGNAHIGVIRVLEREGFHIRAVAGTSAGGLCGAFFAAGYTTDQMESLMQAQDHSRSYVRQAGDGPAMLGLSGIYRLIQQELGHLTFADLKIPFAVTAVDLDNAQKVVLNTGSVCEALMATIAVPGIFPPRVWQGRTLIDGGVLDPVPVSLARALAPGLPVVAVVLSPSLESWVGKPKPRLLNNLPLLDTYISRLRIAQAFNIFLSSVDMAGASMTDMRLRMDKPDVIIRPKVSDIGLLDPVNIRYVVQQGEQAAEAVLPELRRLVTWRYRFVRRIQQNFPSTIFDQIIRKPNGP